MTMLYRIKKTHTSVRAMTRIGGLRNGMNKRTFYKERKINYRSIDVLIS